jgi:hypothetical protein
MPYQFQSVFGALLFDNLGPYQNTQLAWFCDAIGIAVDPVYTLVAGYGFDGDPDYVPGYGALFDPLIADPANLPYLGQFVGVTIPTGTDPITARALVIAENGKNRGTLTAIRSAVERSISTPWAPNVVFPPRSIVSFGSPAVYYLLGSTGIGAATEALWLQAMTFYAVPEIDITKQYQVIERFAPPGTYVNTLAPQWDRAVGTWRSVSPSVTWNNYAGPPPSPAYQLTVVVRPEQLTPTSNTAALIANVVAVKPAGILLYIVAADSPEWFQATKTWAAVSGSVQWATLTTGDV